MTLTNDNCLMIKHFDRWRYDCWIDHACHQVMVVVIVSTIYDNLNYWLFCMFRTHREYLWMMKTIGWKWSIERWWWRIKHMRDIIFFIINTIYLILKWGKGNGYGSSHFWKLFDFYLLRLWIWELSRLLMYEGEKITSVVCF